MNEQYIKPSVGSGSIDEQLFSKPSTGSSASRQNVHSESSNAAFPSLHEPAAPSSMRGSTGVPGVQIQGSIWADRPVSRSPLADSRRARAGTLPSHFNPLRSESLNRGLLRQTLTTRTPSYESPPMGSLALMSPTGNDVLWDSETQAFPSMENGRPMAAKNLSADLQNLSIGSDNYFTNQNTLGAGSSGSLNLSSSRGHGRARSESLSALRPNSIPSFVEKIWSTSPGTNSLTPPSSQTSVNSSLLSANSASQASGLASSRTPEPMRNSPLIATRLDDQVIPHLAELPAHADPSRLRAYTLSSPSVFDPTSTASLFSQQQQEQQHQQHQQQQQQLQQQQAPQFMQSASPGLYSRGYTNAQPSLSHLTVGAQTLGVPRQNRARAQTVGSAQARQYTVGVPLGHHGKQHYILNEIGDGPSAAIDELSLTPTNCLLVSNVPANATSYSLHTIFSGYGRLYAARILPSENCALVVFSNVNSAIDAQSELTGKELYPGCGATMINFARLIGDMIEQPDIRTREPQETAAVAPKLEPSTDSCSSARALDLLESFGQAAGELKLQKELVASALKYTGLRRESAPAAEVSERAYPSTILRDVRKKIDAKQVSKKEIEELALDMIKELPVLAGDYVGNTVVQQLFEKCREEIKDMMLRSLQSQFAVIGSRKNGTWAVQKIIEVANTSRQKDMIIEALRPYSVMLFADQFGNYVIQGCLKFETPWNDFIFESIVANMSEVALSRFGARAMRTCLESPLAATWQKNLVIALIIEYSPVLATNANGSILLTWLFDSCFIPHKFGYTASKILPFLAHLATSKLGSVTLLRILANTNEPDAGQMLLDKLLEPSSEHPSETLAQILADPVNGPLFLCKLLTLILEHKSFEYQVAVNKIRLLLLKPGALLPANRRLLEEVGLAMLIPHEHSEMMAPQAGQTSTEWVHQF